MLQTASNNLYSCQPAAKGATGELFSQLITTLAASQCAFLSEITYPRSCTSDLKTNDTFDFIIVGAGSAGSVLAARLAENPKWRILLIEAGNDPSIASQIPTAFSTIFSTYEDWNYSYELSDKACLGTRDGQCKTPHGKAIGGNGIMDWSEYSRGAPCEYNAWYKLGLTNWNWTNVLPYFVKAENTKYKLFQDDPNHGTEGPWKNNYYDSKQPIKDCILNTVKELGVGSYNHEVPIGYFECLNYIYKGTRVFPAEAYLSCKSKHGCPKNLFIAKNTQVEKVLISKKSLVAYGVRAAISKNKSIILKAKHEVVIAAGTINSAGLLMQSGIGPFDDLKKAGIDGCVDADVGKNLIEPLMFLGFVLKLEKGAAKNQCSSANPLFEYFLTRQGPASTVGMLNLIGKINTASTDIKADECSSKSANIKIYHNLYPRNSADFLWSTVGKFNINDQGVLDAIAANKEFDILYMAPTLVKPASRGQVTLTGRHRDPIKLAGNFFCEEEDVQAMLGAVRFLEQLINHEQMGKYKPQLIRFTVEACNEFDEDSDDYWICLIRHYSVPVLHTAGTVKMGMSGEKCDVVNQDLEVRHVKHLRVVGSAVVPSMISGSMRTVAVMMAEKLADIIKFKYAGDVKRHEMDAVARNLMHYEGSPDGERIIV